MQLLATLQRIQRSCATMHVAYQSVSSACNGAECPSQAARWCVSAAPLQHSRSAGGGGDVMSCSGWHCHRKGLTYSQPPPMGQQASVSALFDLMAELMPPHCSHMRTCGWLVADLWRFAHGTAYDARLNPRRMPDQWLYAPDSFECGSF